MDVKGNTAVVMAGYTFKGTMAGPDGKTHKMASTGTSKDTLVKTDKGWLFKKVQAIKETTTMDGKPFDPSKMAAPVRKPLATPTGK